MDSSSPGHGNGSGDTNVSASLDHALLESLFYNEMMMMEESSLFLSTLAADGAHASADPSTLAEKALLHDFGVSSFPALRGPNSNIDHYLPPSVAQMPHVMQAIPSAPVSSSLYASPSAPETASLSPLVAPPRATNDIPVREAALTPPPCAVSEEEKRNKLVAQFATLASRLGISLPPQLIQSLTAAAAAKGNDVPAPQLSSMETSALRNLAVDGSSFLSVPEAPPRQVQELQIAAEVAIAAVTRKRSHDESSPTAAAVASNNNNNKQPYGKRRKKPRLNDCERRLAALQAENALLKRHLHSISDQSHKLVLEQRAAEEKIRQLWKDNAGEKELDAIVKHFTEMYSDYGKRRHQELTFHLEQLEL
jgi:hypothetical protein